MLKISCDDKDNDKYIINDFISLLSLKISKKVKK